MGPRHDGNGGKQYWCDDSCSKMNTTDAPVDAQTFFINQEDIGPCYDVGAF